MPIKLVHEGPSKYITIKLVSSREIALITVDGASVSEGLVTVAILDFINITLLYRIYVICFVRIKFCKSLKKRCESYKFLFSVYNFS